MGKSLMFAGTMFCLASGLLFQYRLFSLDRFLKHYHPDLWSKFGSGNQRLHLLAKYNRLRSLALEYEPEDPEIDSRLKVINVLHLTRLCLFVG